MFSFVWNANTRWEQTLKKLDRKKYIAETADILNSDQNLNRGGDDFIDFIFKIWYLKKILYKFI